jgi:hypothetical protein
VSVIAGVVLAAQEPQTKGASEGSAAMKVGQDAVKNGGSKANDSGKSEEDTASTSLAPVVYKDDQMPGLRGYHYTFFGNAFFINEQGYLLTVAHVVETFGEGSQPYILVSRANAPPHLVAVTVIAKDAAHDVAVLRATPNPFSSNDAVSFVPLSTGKAMRGEVVLALSLHPKQAQYAQSYDLPREDSSPGTVLSFESTQLAKSAAPADVFLLSHPVVKGQSGSPVMDLQTHAAIGLVEGIWMRGTYSPMSKATAQSTDAPGAAIPIQYAIALLKESGVTWHGAAPLTSAPPISSLQR